MDFSILSQSIYQHASEFTALRPVVKDEFALCQRDIHLYDYQQRGASQPGYSSALHSHIMDNPQMMPLFLRPKQPLPLCPSQNNNSNSLLNSSVSSEASSEEGVGVYGSPISLDSPYAAYTTTTPVIANHTPPAKDAPPTSYPKPSPIRYADQVISLMEEDSPRSSRRRRLPLRSQNFDLTRLVQHARDLRQITGKAMQCMFCQNNGESYEVFSSHMLKTSDGRVLCPILRAYQCPKCGATGDTAHTIKYCPFSDKRERLPSLKLERQLEKLYQELQTISLHQ